MNAIDFKNGYEMGQRDAKRGLSLASWKLDGYPKAYVAGYERAQDR